jgi:hypothetical protein
MGTIMIQGLAHFRELEAGTEAASHIRLCSRLQSSYQHAIKMLIPFVLSRQPDTP